MIEANFGHDHEIGPRAGLTSCQFDHAGGHVVSHERRAWSSHGTIIPLPRQLAYNCFAAPPDVAGNFKDSIRRKVPAKLVHSTAITLDCISHDDLTDLFSVVHGDGPQRNLMLYNRRLPSGAVVVQCQDELFTRAADEYHEHQHGKSVQVAPCYGERRLVCLAQRLRCRPSAVLFQSDSKTQAKNRYRERRSRVAG